MIIKYSNNNENRIQWQHRKGEEWKTAELDELIEAYEREKTGKWIFSPDHAEGVCTRCNYKIYGRPYQNTYVIVPYNYCPNCGARMVGE